MSSSLAQILANYIINDNLNAIEELINQGFNVNKPQKEFGLVYEPTYQFYKLLNGSIYYGSGFGSNMEFGEYIPWTPLQFAAILGRDLIIQKLLLKSDITIKDKAGQTAKDIAKRRSHMSTVDILDAFSQFQIENEEPKQVSQIPNDSEELLNEMNIFKIENDSLKHENASIKSSFQQLKNENENFKRNQQIYEQFLKDPENMLSSDNKLQELISLQIPLRGVGLFFNQNSFYDKNSAIKLGAISSILELSNRIDEIFNNGSFDSLEVKLLYNSVCKLLEKWKSDELNVPEFDKEMMINSESIIIKEKIKYFKLNGELFTRKLFELYEHSRLSNQKSNNLIFICLDKLSHDHDLQKSILNEFISAWIIGKDDSDLNQICQQLSIEMKEILKQVKSKNTIETLLPKWQKRKNNLEIVVNCKNIISKLE